MTAVRVVEGQALDLLREGEWVPTPLGCGKSEPPYIRVPDAEQLDEPERIRLRERVHEHVAPQRGHRVLVEEHGRAPHTRSWKWWTIGRT